ncbi:hypothetical protein AXF42_Ash011125 [Apostasia shenzhenica]|uniref:Myb/SANT-like DNA-binding domain-containing protein n=1 Tax=Apostasia shenzhenica TaxID=1088818 RepID=A0A2I0AL59_9ASPA|nr:hypothetical protein AXF42_Ash011125 [Apostasia shenzhenica]
MDSGRRSGGGGGGGTGGGGGLREDCWSEGATEALLGAWSDRFLQLSRGHLRQKDWKEVADSVNARQDAQGKLRKTDGQCKNRIDTLKKKYKLELAKSGPSSWPFFSRLDLLLGTSPDHSARRVQSLPAAADAGSGGHRSLTFKVNQRNPNSSPGPPASLAVSSWGSSRVRTNFRDATQSSRDDNIVGFNAYLDDDMDINGEGENENGNTGFLGSLATRKRRQPWGRAVNFSADAVGGDVGNSRALRELAMAIEKIADVYERVERSKLQQSIEMERQRMEFEKELEIQRMQTFMDTQLELEKLKRPKYASDSGKLLLNNSCYFFDLHLLKCLIF